ncbi:uncharacterized protein BP5553_04732 [Venustampulla echinocandica]|uniref:Uncharacterized protein n=1 Tax=Venustampulla echinocandica TaxID=2656787 RepID=A0A370TP45_9HELO|nr:uncharacterized protein BP5553_04732 [Venustampulla echinocandica]RDL37299.1 hypothetical protein BP5553_04732 [Venustampulla echinocandica]
MAIQPQSPTTALVPTPAPPIQAQAQAPSSTDIGQVVEKEEQETSPPKEFSILISSAGNWTKFLIESPSSSLYIRYPPAAGFLRISLLFNRIVLVATGSGIGP